MDASRTAYALSLREKYLAEAPEAPDDVAVPEVFWYIHLKAFVFRTVGPDEYRQNDAFQLPPAHLPAARLDAITRGCEQLLRFRGISPDRPLENIGVDGFYALMRLFHFQAEKQQVYVREQRPEIFLDEMLIKHVVDGRELSLYNAVGANPPRRANAGPPCPFCGEPLRTPVAKQCRHCRMDWHHPENVDCRK